jgi:hypothetical protein
MQRKVFEHGTWLWIVLSGATVSAVVFAIWEMISLPTAAPTSSSCADRK